MCQIPLQKLKLPRCMTNLFLILPVVDRLPAAYPHSQGVFWKPGTMVYRKCGRAGHPADHPVRLCLQPCSQRAKALPDVWQDPWHLSSLDLFLAKWFMWCLYVRIWGSMFMVLIWLCFLNQGLSGPQPCCLVYGLMASHWIYDLQPTGPHPAPYPGNGLGGNLSWWRGWWPSGPAMGSGVSEIWRMWIATDWNRWLPRIDLMGRHFTIPPLWGRSFLFAAKLQELLPTG